MWDDLLWVGRCKVARGEIDGAIEFMTKAVNPWTPMAGLARFAEAVLLQFDADEAEDLSAVLDAFCAFATRQQRNHH